MRSNTSFGVAFENNIFLPFNSRDGSKSDNGLNWEDTCPHSLKPEGNLSEPLALKSSDSFCIFLVLIIFLSFLSSSFIFSFLRVDQRFAI